MTTTSKLTVPVVVNTSIPQNMDGEAICTQELKRAIRRVLASVENIQEALDMEVVPMECSRPLMQAAQDVTMELGRLELYRQIRCGSYKVPAREE